MGLAALCLMSTAAELSGGVFPWDKCWAILAFNSLYVPYCQSEDPIERRSSAVTGVQTSTMRCMQPKARMARGRGRVTPIDSAAGLPTLAFVSGTLSAASLAQQSGEGSAVLQAAVSQGGDVSGGLLPCVYAAVAAEHAPRGSNTAGISRRREASVRDLRAAVAQLPRAGPAPAAAVTQATSSVQALLASAGGHQQDPLAQYLAAGGAPLPLWLLDGRRVRERAPVKKLERPYLQRNMPPAAVASHAARLSGTFQGVLQATRASGVGVPVQAGGAAAAGPAARSQGAMAGAVASGLVQQQQQLRCEDEEEEQVGAGGVAARFSV